MDFPLFCASSFWEWRMERFSKNFYDAGMRLRTGNGAQDGRNDQYGLKKQKKNLRRDRSADFEDGLQALRASTATRATDSSASMPAGASPRVLTTVFDDASAVPRLCPPYVLFHSCNQPKFPNIDLRVVFFFLCISFTFEQPRSHSSATTGRRRISMGCASP